MKSAVDEEESIPRYQMQGKRAGAFWLEEKIGQGGMGEVYRGRHESTGVAVAVKILRERLSVQGEGEAQARLNHPGVVHLFDYGEIEIEEGECLPYVAMEYAREGSLAQRLPLRSWVEAQVVLLQILDALAAAHAREVIHRDLKPENLLIFAEANGDFRIKLADFGLAHRVVRTRENGALATGAFSGTPHYMAPEQLVGEWRKYGPWTDLYALGCIGWNLICGKPPVEANTPVAVAMRHLSRRFEPFRPLYSVPEGTKEWLEQLLAQDPARRFQRAAEAARGLVSLGGVGAEAPYLSLQALPRGEGAFTVPLSEPLTLRETIPRPEGGAVRGSFSEQEGCLLSEPLIELPLPESWAEEEALRPPAPLVGTGLGLFGLREASFVGREKERDRIWEALRRVVEERRFQLVVIRGEAGVGKSRLSQWICTRAHEVGAVEVLPAYFQSRGQGTGEGLSGMIQGFFQSWNLPRAELYERLCRGLPPLDEENRFREVDARGLTELIDPEETESVEGGPTYHFTSAKQRDALVGRFLARVARKRRVLIYLDDIQFSEAAPRLLAHLQELGEDAPPILAVATVRKDLVCEDPVFEKQLKRICADRSTTVIDLSPIDGEEHRRWIEETLPLASALVEKLAERTEGNPLFAHQLLGHWIASKSLVLTDQGFQVHREAEAAMPGELHSLWMARIDALLEGYEEKVRLEAEEWLLRAAVLGKEVHAREWSRLHHDDNRMLREELLDDLVARGLAVRITEGFRFAHGLLVESLCERADRDGRLQAYHLRAAEMLGESYPNNPGARGRREGEHFAAAGEFARALEPLWAALEYYGKQGFQGRWQETGELHRRCAQACDDEKVKTRHTILNQLYRGRMHYLDGEFSEALKITEKAIESAERAEEREGELRARLFLGRLIVQHHLGTRPFDEAHCAKGKATGRR